MIRLYALDLHLFVENMSQRTIYVSIIYSVKMIKKKKCPRDHIKR